MPALGALMTSSGFASTLDNVACVQRRPGAASRGCHGVKGSHIRLLFQRPADDLGDRFGIVDEFQTQFFAPPPHNLGGQLADTRIP